MPSAGDVLQDRYELSSPIATGGMGEVWRGQDRVLGRAVAVKVLRSEYTGDPVFLTRFRTEARLSAGLTHPNVAVLHDYGEVEPASPGGDRLVYLVMELVDGEPLSAVLAREGRLTSERTLDLLGQVASGLAAAHAAGVVHRDVKPANLLVRPDGIVKITDFGIAWSAANATVTRTGHVVGTAQYLAPEQVQGQKATPAADVYAWGTVAYECLAGRRPFDGPVAVEVALQRVTEQPAPLPADVPAPVRELVERTLATNVPDDGTDADGDDDRSRVRRLVVPVLVGLVATALVVTGLVLGSRDVPAADPAPAAAPTSTAPPAPTTPRATGTFVRVDPADHVGQPVAEVQAWLTGLDLPVVLRTEQTTEVPAGQVIRLEPTGELPVGTTVTVTHAVAPPPPPPAPTTAAPSPAPVAATQDEDQGRKKEQKERGRDRERDRDDDEDD
jgi:serine/threonine-protein kinase